jgi:hypothetical protein
VGNSIRSDDRYYDRGRGGRYVETARYTRPAPVYYESAPVYYAPPPRVVYVEPARPYYREVREYREYRDERWEHHHHHDRGRW